MVAAPDPMSRAIIIEGIVVDLPIPGELGEKVRYEPEEAVGLTNRAQRYFEIGNAPTSLELAPRQRKPQGGGASFAPSTEDARPEVFEQGAGDGIAGDSPHAVGKRREETFIPDGQVLEWHFSSPAIEL